MTILAPTAGFGARAASPADADAACDVHTGAPRGVSSSSVSVSLVSAVNPALASPAPATWARAGVVQLFIGVAGAVAPKPSHTVTPGPPTLPRACLPRVQAGQQRPHASLEFPPTGNEVRTDRVSPWSSRSPPRRPAAAPQKSTHPIAPVAGCTLHPRTAREAARSPPDVPLRSTIVRPRLHRARTASAPSFPTGAPAPHDSDTKAQSKTRDCTGSTA